MKETKVMDKIHKDLLKKYHTLAGQLGMTDEEKRALLAQYKVASSADLSQHELVDVCACLSREIERRDGHQSMDALRKRLIAVVGKYLKACGKSDVTISYIKATACRAAGIREFNRIPRERLRSLYGAFMLKLKDINRVEAMYKEARR
ncbi:hypothetical protein [Porphyromonas endodontalis]|uniref:hypothetical protein n=1 Tax=Porphyromonas endodontalis TaxID=28124 RepID=UPI0028E263CD|nr:hypothetical protein [Porphyromonas endodontalis]